MKARLRCIKKQSMIVYMESSEAIEDRLEVACLLGEWGDPRLLLPTDGQYWIKVETAYLDLLIGKNFPVTVYEWKQLH